MNCFFKIIIDLCYFPWLHGLKKKKKNEQTGPAIVYKYNIIIAKKVIH